MFDRSSAKFSQLIIDGKPHNRVKYGEDGWGNGGKCHDCGAKEGEYHVVGCDVERCPKCGMQLISCDCLGDATEYQLVGEIIDLDNIKDIQDFCINSIDASILTLMSREIPIHEIEKIKSKHFDFDKGCLYINNSVIALNSRDMDMFQNAINQEEYLLNIESEEIVSRPINGNMFQITEDVKSNLISIATEFGLENIIEKLK